MARICPRLKDPRWWGTCYCQRSKAMARKQFLLMLREQDYEFVQLLVTLENLFVDRENWRRW